MKRLVVAALLMGCTEGSPLDICNDRAWDACAEIADRDCGLSANASEIELQSCELFRRCDNRVFDDCMTEHGS